MCLFVCLFVCLFYLFVCVYCKSAGIPGVKVERFEEGMKIKHCALSLVGKKSEVKELSAWQINSPFVNSDLFNKPQTRSRNELKCIVFLSDTETCASGDVKNCFIILFTFTFISIFGFSVPF